MTISTHVLDTSAGRPASAVEIRLLRQQGSNWIELFRGATNDDGRVPSLLPAAPADDPGTYRVTFDAGDYFQRQNIESFYATITIDFIVRDTDGHYHVPLLLSPFGYSTYRGS